MDKRFYMNLLLIKILITALVAFGSVFIAVKFTKNPYGIAVIVALLSLASSELIGAIALRHSDPRVEVRLQEEKKGEIEVHVSSKRGVQNLDIELHTLGPVSDIHDFNEKTGYGSVLKEVLGHTSGIAQNTVAISLTDVSSGHLTYKILYEPVPGDWVIAGADVFQYRYTWSLGGDVLEKKVYKSVSTGEEVNKPWALVKGAVLYDRKLTDEEVKQEYEKGVPTRRFE